MNLCLKEKLFVQRSQQRGQARNIIWRCRAMHLCWTEPVLLLCLLCLIWRGVFGNRGISASSPCSLPCALAEKIPLSRSWLFLPWQEPEMFWEEKLPPCRVRQGKKPKGKYRKGGSTKKDCRNPENMNMYLMHFCSDCCKEVAKALAQSPVPITVFQEHRTSNIHLIPGLTQHTSEHHIPRGFLQQVNTEWSFHKASSNTWFRSEVKIDINENQSFQRESDTIKDGKVPSKARNLLF